MLVAAMVVGLVMHAVYALQAGTGAQFASVTSVGITIVGASAAVGGLIGFVFGIPRLLQDPRSAASSGVAATEAAQDQPAPYAGNTSLPIASGEHARRDRSAH